MSAILNDFAQKKIAQTKENLDNGIESSDFISVYLKEVENSKGKLQDRYIPIFKILTFLPINRDYFDKWLIYDTDILNFRKETSGESTGFFTDYM